MPLSEFTDDQIRKHRLEDYIYPESNHSERSVMFRVYGKPYLVPVIFSGNSNDNVELIHWGGCYPESLLNDGILQGAEPRQVEIPAYEAHQGSFWFKVAPQKIQGILVPKDRYTSQVYILTMPAGREFETMTHAKWEPVCDQQPNYLRL